MRVVAFELAPSVVTSSGEFKSERGSVSQMVVR